MNVRVRDLLMSGSYGAISTSAHVDVRRSEFASWDSSIYEARSIRLVDVVNGQDGLLHATGKISLKNVRTASAVESDARIVGRNVTLVGFGAACPPVEAPTVRISGLVADNCTP
jgi:hypothetical protein